MAGWTHCDPFLGMSTRSTRQRPVASSPVLLKRADLESLMKFLHVAQEEGRLQPNSAVPFDELLAAFVNVCR